MKVFVIRKNIKIGGKVLPPDTIMAEDKNGLIYACLKYPKMYQGKKPRLELYIYDRYTGLWEWGVYQDAITAAIHNGYIMNTRQRPKQDKNNYADMMKHSRRKKYSGGVYRERIDAVTDYACSVTAPFADFGRAVRVMP